ncbi:hypothetical protein N7490_001751 [Penicillium lividum]|nr:hypothetical protein N7490_001751 [Penicillium lividum]
MLINEPLTAQWSKKGAPVSLIDTQEQQLKDALECVQKLREEEIDPAESWGEITLSQTPLLESSLKNTWLVIECVPERLPLKQYIITLIDKLAPERVVIASNSSSYGISEILVGLNLKHKNRVLSAHCYWPPQITAIEIMGHDETDEFLISLVLDRCKVHGFSPFHVKQTSLGYIYNRIWAAIKRETLLALSEGVCTPQEVDAIFKNVLKSPKGPCEMMDLVGLDVVLDIENHYASARSGVPTEPRDYLRKMIQDGNLGIKSGHGFYDYEGTNSEDHS